MKKQKNAGFIHWYKVLILLIISSSLLSSLLWSLDPASSLNRYLVDKWQMADGFPSDEITSIAQAGDGYLWFATSKGLVRFDGQKFAIVSFAEQKQIAPRKTATPLALYTDSAGKLWIGSTAGLTTYNYHSRSFHMFQPSGAAASPLPTDRIRCITGDMNSNLWITFFSSFAGRITGNTFTHYNEKQGLEDRKIDAVIEDHQGNLLFGTKGKGVFIYRDEKFLPYPIVGLDASQNITCMLEDSRGILWIGTRNGLYRVVDKTAKRYTKKDGLASDFISVLQEDSRGNLWVATIGGGLHRLKRTGDTSNKSPNTMGRQEPGDHVPGKQSQVVNDKTNEIITFEKHGAPLSILCLLEDREKSLWIGTLNSGLRRLKDAKFSTYGPGKNLPGDTLLSLYQDAKGDTWIGTLKGKLIHCRGNKQVETLQLPYYPGTGISAILEDKAGRLWLGTNGKGILIKQKNGTISPHKSPASLSDNQVNSLFMDSRGHIWISTVNGLSISIKGTSGFLTSTSRYRITGKTIHNVYEDSLHNIWIAANKGITFLKSNPVVVQLALMGSRPHEERETDLANGDSGPQASRKKWAAEKSENLRHFLEGISVTCLHEDRKHDGKPGTLYWAATDGAGLIRIAFREVEEGPPVASTFTFTTGQGLAANVIYQFFEDEQGYFWIMSNNGILRINKNELNRCARGEIKKVHCTTYDTQEGMVSSEFNNEFSRHSAIQTDRGEYWFITKKGISIVQPGKINIDKTPPPVVIESVLIDRQPVPVKYLEQQGNQNYQVKDTYS